MIFIKAIDVGLECWVSGIYKITKYADAEFGAYFIQEWQQNWGDCVDGSHRNPSASGPTIYPSFETATAACRKHAEGYVPSEAIKKRAKKILDYMIATGDTP